MIRIGFYSKPTNAEVGTYLGLYGGSFLFEYVEKGKDLQALVSWFLETAKSSLDIEYNHENLIKAIELYHCLKREKWEGYLRVYTDDKQKELLNFSFVGYDIGADSSYYSPLGDGFLLEYDSTNKFFSEMSVEMFSKFRNNINDKGLFNSYDLALEFAKYCNYINKKHLHSIESEDNWRPFAIYLFA